MGDTPPRRRSGLIETHFHNSGRSGALSRPHDADNEDADADEGDMVDYSDSADSNDNDDNNDDNDGDEDEDGEEGDADDRRRRRRAAAAAAVNSSPAAAASSPSTSSSSSLASSSATSAVPVAAAVDEYGSPFRHRLLSAASTTGALRPIQRPGHAAHHLRDRAGSTSSTNSTGSSSSSSSGGRSGGRGSASVNRHESYRVAVGQTRPPPPQHQHHHHQHQSGYDQQQQDGDGEDEDGSPSSPSASSASSPAPLSPAAASASASVGSSFSPPSSAAAKISKIAALRLAGQRSSLRSVTKDSFRIAIDQTNNPLFTRGEASPSPTNNGNGINGNGQQLQPHLVQAPQPRRRSSSGSHTLSYLSMRLDESDEPDGAADRDHHDHLHHFGGSSSIVEALSEQVMHDAESDEELDRSAANQPPHSSPSAAAAAAGHSHHSHHQHQHHHHHHSHHGGGGGGVHYHRPISNQPQLTTMSAQEARRRSSAASNTTIATLVAADAFAPVSLATAGPGSMMSEEEYQATNSVLDANEVRLRRRSSTIDSHASIETALGDELRALQLGPNPTARDLSPFSQSLLGSSAVSTPSPTNLFSSLRVDIGAQGAGFAPGSPSAKRERQRMEIFNEIASTEQSYLRDLEVLESVFIKGVEKAKVISKYEASGIFANAAELVPLHMDILSDLFELQRSFAATGVVVMDAVGQVFLSRASTLSAAYGKYVSNKQNAERVLASCKKQNKAFSTFLDTCLGLPECRKLDLQSFLTAPFQRITRYGLLLKSLASLSPTAVSHAHAMLAQQQQQQQLQLRGTMHVRTASGASGDAQPSSSNQSPNPDSFMSSSSSSGSAMHGLLSMDSVMSLAIEKEAIEGSALAQALQALDAIVVQAEEKALRAENIQRLIEINSSTDFATPQLARDFAIVTSARQLLLEGNLVRHVSTHVSQNVHLFLFNDYMLLAVTKKDRFFVSEPPLPVHELVISNVVADEAPSASAQHRLDEIANMPLPPNPIVKTRKSSKSLSSALPPPLPSPTLTRSTRMRASTDVDAALKPGRQQAAASPTPSGTVHPLSSISAPTPSVTGGNSSLLASPSHGSGVAGNRLSHSSVGSNDSGADGSFGLDDSSESISRSPRASVVVAPGDRSLASSEDGFGSVSNLSSNNSLGGTPPGSPLLDDVGPGLTRGNTRRKLPFASESATDMRASMRMRRGSLFKNRDNCFFVAHVGFKVFEFEAPTEYDKVVWMKAIGHAIGDQITSLYRGTHEPASASNASSPVASATTTPLLTPQHSSAGLVTAASMISSNGSSLLPSHSTSAIFATTAYASGSPIASTPSPVSVAELHSAPRPASLSSRKDLIEEIFIESNV